MEINNSFPLVGTSNRSVSSHYDNNSSIVNVEVGYNLKYISIIQIESRKFETAMVVGLISNREMNEFHLPALQ